LPFVSVPHLYGHPSHQLTRLSPILQRRPPTFLVPPFGSLRDEIFTSFLMRNSRAVTAGHLAPVFVPDFFLSPQPAVPNLLPYACTGFSPVSSLFPRRSRRSQRLPSQPPLPRRNGLALLFISFLSPIFWGRCGFLLLKTVPFQIRGTVSPPPCSSCFFTPLFR